MDTVSALTRLLIYFVEYITLIIIIEGELRNSLNLSTFVHFVSLVKACVARVL